MKTALLILSFQSFMPHLLVVVMLYMWALVVKYMRRYNIDFSTLLGIDDDHHRRLHKFLGGLTLWLFFSALLFFFTPDVVALGVPLLVYPLGILVVLFFTVRPFEAFVRLLETVVHVFKIWHCPALCDMLLLDVMTSLSKVFGDLVCMSVRWHYGQSHTETWLHEDSTCGGHYITMSMAMGIAYLMRFCQCVRCWDIPGVFNALKYAASISVFVFSALESAAAATPDARLYHTCWIWASVTSSTATFVWDVFRDWGLWSRYGDNEIPAHHRPTFKLCMWLLLSDGLLRFSWTYKLILPKPYPMLLVLIAAVLEILRRSQWLFFRLQNQHVIELKKKLVDLHHKIADLMAGKALN